VLSDRLRQIDQIGFTKTTPRVARVRGDEFDRNRAIRRELVCRFGSRTVHVTDQGGKTPSKASSWRLFVHQFIPVSQLVGARRQASSSSLLASLAECPRLGKQPGILVRLEIGRTRRVFRPNSTRTSSSSRKCRARRAFSVVPIAPFGNEAARRDQDGTGLAGTPVGASVLRLRVVSERRIIANTMMHRGGFGNQFGGESW
jgi:hypothetical protein